MMICHRFMFIRRFFVVGSEDMTARVFSITPMEGHHAFVVTGHRNCVVGCFFEENSLNVSFLIYYNNILML